VSLTLSFGGGCSFAVAFRKAVVEVHSFGFGVTFDRHGSDQLCVGIEWIDHAAGW
jgi:hypothetical protein